MPSRCCRFFAAILLLAAAGLAHAMGDAVSLRVPLAATPRVFVTLTPYAAESAPRSFDLYPEPRPGWAFPLRPQRRNRLEFAIVRHGVLASNDRLQLRLASDAHVFAQLLSGGRFSETDDSWLAVLGLASRVRLSYTNGPWDLTVSARRKFGDSDVRARFSYKVRF